MSRSRLATAVVAGMALSLPMAAVAQEQPGQRGPVIEAARQVTTSPNPVRLHSTPQIAVHPDDPSTAVIAVGDARNGGCALHVTRDGGLSWAVTAENLLPEGYQFCIHNNFGPYITPAFASDGTLYVGLSGSSVEKGHPRGPIDGLIAVSEDLGRTVETRVFAKSEDFRFDPADYGIKAQEGRPAPRKQTGFTQVRYNSLAVDPTDPDTLYVGWRQGVEGLQGVSFGTVPVRSMIAVSSDGGQTWSEPIDVAATFSPASGEEELFGSDIPMLVVAPDGTAYAFTKERPKSAPEGEPRPSSRLFMFKSADGGSTWSTTVINEGAPYITNPAAAVDPTNGNLYVTYESRGDDEVNPADVYFMASTDGGSSWSTPVNLTDDDPNKSYNQYFPGISVAPSGRIDVAWYDYRNDPFFTPGEAGSMGTTEGERYWDVYHTYSTDGGRSWSENLRVTDRSIDGEIGTTFSNNDIIAPMGIASTDSMALITWPDSRAGSPELQAEDAYFTRVRLAGAAGDGAVADASDDRVMWGVLGAGAALAVGGLVLLLGTRFARRRPEGTPATAPTQR